MKHARKDYNRIQDLALIAQAIKRDIKAYREEWHNEEAATTMQAFLDWLDDTYGPFDVEPIPEDEPVFMLRAKDMNATLVVRIWADLAERHGAASNIVEAARQHAELIKDWPIKQIPDMPEDA